MLPVLFYKQTSIRQQFLERWFNLLFFGHSIQLVEQLDAFTRDVESILCIMRHVLFIERPWSLADR